MSTHNIDQSPVMRRDRRRIQRALERQRSDAREMLDASRQRVASRRASVPQVQWDESLPITAHLERIGELIRAHPVVIVAGETGSGKTTQLPKLCLSLGYGVTGMIGHTQPRRLAARAVARRVADELRVALGNEVGYAVRFTDRVSEQTLIKVVTDGLLLTEIRSDRDLDAYDVLILDEAHERSLNIDFLLGYVTALLRRRPDLKVIVTSATIDVEAFARHFGGAPVVEVGGRGYPVDVRYLHDVPEDPDIGVLVLDTVREIAKLPRRGARDVLVFLTGEREIFDVARLLRRELGERYEVMPLYARLPAGEQQRIFAPSTRTRIVLATNVAETSLTVPNIGFVVDSGRARISRYSYRSKLTRLHVESISKASADQRKGRCGRIAPGTCFRLYAEADYASRDDYTEPEIHRTNLASVVLQMRAFRLGSVSGFPFLDPPEPKAVRDAERLLEELGAFVDDELTDIGRAMARLPVDPRLARMLVAGARLGALREVLVIVSALAVQDPRDRPIDARDAADAKHREFDDPRSDFLAFWNLWKWYDEMREGMTKSALVRECERRFLSPMRMREWRDLHRQLLLACRELRLTVNQQDADFAAIHRAILTGALGQIGLKRDEGDYLGPRAMKFRIFPGSALAKARPKWIVGAEITDTGRTYARCVADVDPRWVEEAAPHLVARTYSDPQWNEKRGEVIAFERVVLYGLPLVERRPVSYKGIDPGRSRSVFLNEALVPGALRTNGEFLRHNLELVREIREREARERRRDLLVTDDVLAAFYDERLAADVCDTVTFERWRRDAERRDARVLFMSPNDVMRIEAARGSDADFPSSVAIDGVAFDVKYAFAPGARDDGVSLQVPLGMLSHVRAEPLEWLVPGLLAKKCEELVRSLPKALRRPLAPVPDAMAKVTPLLEKAQAFRRGMLTLALAERIEGIHGVHVPTNAWDVDKLPPHLVMNVQVRDADGRIVDQDRSVDALKARLLERTSERLESGARQRYERSALTEFPQEIPEQIVLTQASGASIAYPSLVDRGDRVDLELLPTREAQAVEMPRGCTRLVLLLYREPVRHMRRVLKGERALGLHFATLGTLDELVDSVLRASVWHCFFEEAPTPRTAQAFDARLEERRSQLIATFDAVLESARLTLSGRFDLTRLLDRQTSPAYRATVADARSQLARLIPRTFLIDTPLRCLNELPRYLQAIAYRIEHLQGRVEKDQRDTADIHVFEARLDAVAKKLADTPLDAARFGIEELRVAVFAQHLGAGKTLDKKERVSAKRLDTMLVALEQRAGIR